jgi:beta-glucanase (GH16 family)
MKDSIILYLTAIILLIFNSLTVKAQGIAPYPGGSGIYTQLVWNDEFDTDGFPDTNKWRYHQGYGYNNELHYYTQQRAENIGISDGILTITARKEDVEIEGATREITSASIYSQYKGDWKYGRIEVRAKMPEPMKGTWPAIWMMPTQQVYGYWPNSGEIDIMEYVGYMPERVHFTLHSYNSNHTGSGGQSSYAQSPSLSTNFHIYAVEWFPDRIDWYFDNQKKFTVSNPETDWKDWPFDQYFYIILNLGYGGSWGGAMGVEKEKLPAEYQIDYVRIFQKESANVISNTKANDTKVCVSPSGEITFISAEITPVQIELTNLQGQISERIFSGHIQPGSNTFLINPKYKGLFLLSVTTNRNRCVHKIILS